jgi:hypothetical protein
MKGTTGTRRYHEAQLQSRAQKAKKGPQFYCSTNISRKGQISPIKALMKGITGTRRYHEAQLQSRLHAAFLIPGHFRTKHAMRLRRYHMRLRDTFSLSSVSTTHHQMLR